MAVKETTGKMLLLKKTRAKSFTHGPEELDFFVPEGINTWEGAKPNRMSQFTASIMSRHFNITKLAREASSLRERLYNIKSDCKPTGHWSKGSMNLVVSAQFEDGKIWILKLRIPEEIIKEVESKYSQTVSSLNFGNAYDSLLKEMRMTNFVRDEAGLPAPCVHGVFPVSSEIESKYRTAVLMMDFVAGYTPSDLLDSTNCGHHNKLCGDTASSDKGCLKTNSVTLPDFERGYHSYCVDENGVKINKSKPPIRTVDVRQQIWYSFARFQLTLAAKFPTPSDTTIADVFDSEDESSSCGHHSKESSQNQEQDDDWRHKEDVGLPEDEDAALYQDQGTESYITQLRDSIIENLDCVVDDYHASTDSTVYCDKIADNIRKATAMGLLDSLYCTQYLVNCDMGDSNAICNQNGTVVAFIDLDSLDFIDVPHWAQPPVLIGLDWFHSTCLFCGCDKDDFELRQIYKNLMIQIGQEENLMSERVTGIINYIDSDLSTIIFGFDLLVSKSEILCKDHTRSNAFLDMINNLDTSSRTLDCTTQEAESKSQSQIPPALEIFDEYGTISSSVNP